MCVFMHVYICVCVCKYIYLHRWGTCSCEFILYISFLIHRCEKKILAYTSWYEAPGTYTEEDCLVWPQGEKMHINLKRIETPGSGEVW